FALVNLLRRGDIAGRVELGGAANAEDIATQLEDELDDEPIAVPVDQLGRPAPATAVMAKEGKGDGIEDGGLAAAVVAGEHPQTGGRVQGNGALIPIAEETLERDLERDHGVTSRISSSARARMRSRLASSCWINSCRR